MPSDKTMDDVSAHTPMLGTRICRPPVANDDTAPLGVFLRELMPQDLKLEIDQLTRDQAVSAAVLCCQVG